MRRLKNVRIFSKSSQALLLLIVLLAFFLRFYKLGIIPPSLSWDEISHGYNAYSILKTGKDQWGQFLPLANFRAYGDYPLPLYMYFSIPSIALFGLNAVSIRIISVIFGVALIPVVYFLVKRIFNNEFAALAVSFLLAVSPWSILTSRQVLQATPATFLMTLGVLLFIKGVKDGKKWILLGTISIGLSAYAYHNTRILAGPILALLILFYWRFLFQYKKVLAGVLIIGAIFILPLIPIVLSPEGSARADWVGIVDQGAINRIDEARGSSHLPLVLNKFVNNRYTYTLEVFVSNYLGYFSPKFLGFEGGSQLQFSVPGFGLVYPVELPFFYIGLLFLIIGFKEDEKEKKFLLIWLLMGIVPAAITRDPYQVVRPMVALPLVYVIEGYGFVIFLKALRGRYKEARMVLLGLMSIVLVIEAGIYYNNLLNTYPVESSFAWQYGYEQAIDFVKDHQSEYSKIIFTKKYGESHEFVLFYLAYDPWAYQNDPTAVKYEAYNWYWVNNFGKYEFYNDEDVIKKTQNQTNVLLITSPGNYPKKGKLLKTINFLDGKEAFNIVSL